MLGGVRYPGKLSSDTSIISIIFIRLVSRDGRATSPVSAPPVPGSKTISNCSKVRGGGGVSNSGGALLLQVGVEDLQEAAEEEVAKFRMH